MTDNLSTESAMELVTVSTMELVSAMELELAVKLESAMGLELVIELELATELESAMGLVMLHMVIFARQCDFNVYVFILGCNKTTSNKTTFMSVNLVVVYMLKFTRT